MRAKLFLFFIFLICAGLIFSVWQKERVLKDGQTFYMELRPVDPRSLLQGDYMALRYKETSDCLLLDDKNIAQAMPPDRKGICKVILKHKPDSFFFQEGHAEIYSRAMYAILKGGGGVQITEVLLAGLADENLKELKP